MKSIKDMILDFYLWKIGYIENKMDNTKEWIKAHKLYVKIEILKEKYHSLYNKLYQ